MTTTPRRLGQYELQKLLGHGNTGEVWQGYDLQRRQNVAVKLLHPDLLQADHNFINHFMKEWQAIIALHHSHIVQVHETNITRSNETRVTTPYIVMDYIEGHTTLADLIQHTSRVGKFPAVADIVSIFSCLGTAVDYAHEQDICHNDIKPSNVLLDMHATQRIASGEPMLTDFGIGNLPGSDAILSPLYLAPEQVNGQQANPSSDIYALGVMLYEMCTGVLPFHGESNVAIMMHHINTLPTPPMLINPHIPAALSEVILRAMAKDPYTRFATASQMATAIAEACAIEQDLHFTLNTTQETADEPLFYMSSGPLPANSETPSVVNRASILGVSQPLPDISAKFAAVQKQGTVRTSGAIPSFSNTATTGQMQQLPLQSAYGSDTLPQRTATEGRRSQVTGKFPTPAPILFPVIQPPVLPNTPTKRPRRKTGSSSIFSPLALVIIFLVLLLVVVGSLAASLLVHPPTQALPKAIVGHVFFQDDALGRDDTLHLTMQNIPAAATGKQYDAWLQNVGGQVTLLGPLTIQNGSASLLYTDNVHHANLLANIQAVFVTQENRGQAPATFSNNAKLYQASFSSTLLPFVQHILYTFPGFPTHGGLSAGLFDTVQGMNDKAGSIADSLQGKTDDALAIRQATRIIEIIDGTSFARSSGDLPQSLPDMLTLPVGLLSSSPTQQGYIDALATQLDKLKQVSGNNTALLQHIQNVQNALTDLREWVAQMRGYDVQILKAANLNDPAILNAALQLKQVTQYAYTGKTIPPNDSPLPILGSAGATQAYAECQYLATLDMQKV